MPYPNSYPKTVTLFNEFPFEAVVLYWSIKVTAGTRGLPFVSIVSAGDAWLEVQVHWDWDYHVCWRVVHEQTEMNRLWHIQTKLQ